MTITTKIANSNEICSSTIREMRMEMTNPDWCAGFTAFDAREPFCMSKGRDWAMGWLSCRLINAGLANQYKH